MWGFCPLWDFTWLYLTSWGFPQTRSLWLKWDCVGHKLHECPSKSSPKVSWWAWSLVLSWGMSIIPNKCHSGASAQHGARSAGQQLNPTHSSGFIIKLVLILIQSDRGLRLHLQIQFNSVAQSSFCPSLVNQFARRNHFSSSAPSLLPFFYRCFCWQWHTHSDSVF